MPNITEEEYKKFKELVDKEKAEEEARKLNRDIYLEELTERVNGILDLNSTYGPIEVYALTFTKFILNDFEAHKQDWIFFKWSELKRYLTKRCLNGDALKKAFRDHMRNRGVYFKIDRKWNTVKVFKKEPRKVTK